MAEKVGGGDKFMRKTEDPKKKTKKPGEDAEGAAKPTMGLARELNMLEERLKMQHLIMDKGDASAAADAKRSSRRGGVVSMRDRKR